MMSSLVFPINARAIGEVTEIFPIVCVGFWLANDLPYLLFAGILFHQRHCRPEFNRIAGKL